VMFVEPNGANMSQTSGAEGLAGTTIIAGQPHIDKRPYSRYPSIVLRPARSWLRIGSPDRSGHPQTPAGTSFQESALADLARFQNPHLLAPPLAPQPVQIFSNLASDLEPPYGIEP
jgi:hypothetical protein